MTTITLIRQLRNWLNGTLVLTRLIRKTNPAEITEADAASAKSSIQQPKASTTAQAKSGHLVQAAAATHHQLAYANALRQYHQALQNTYTPVYQGLLHELPDRFASYKEKIMPKLQEDGYLYFRAGSSNEYQMHEEWCHEHCDAPTLPHCDVWQFDAQYPRAFKNETDATMFALTFDTIGIDTNK
jgi:hypothetical protein